MNFCQWLFARRARILTLFYILDFLVYFDRGIVPGAHNEVTTFLLRARSIHQNPELYFGALQSVFVAGMAFSAPILAYRSALHRSAFYYLGLGLFVWLISLLGCALAYNLNSLTLLYFSRGVSGVGEGAFVGLMAPMLLDASNCQNRGVLLGIFYGLMPAGMTAGYVISAAVVSAGYSWAHTFLGLALCGALPIAAILLGTFFNWIADSVSPLKHINSEISSTVPNMELQKNLEEGKSSSVEGDNGNAEIAMSFRHCCLRLCQSGAFPALLLCGASQAGVGASLSSFGAAFLMNLGLIKSELSAATAMGTFGACTITLGTFLGGFWIRSISALEDERDWLSPQGAQTCEKETLGAWAEESMAAYRLRLYRIECHAKFVSKVGAIAGLAVVLAPVLLYLQVGTIWVYGFLATGLVLLGSLQSGLNVCVMSAAPESYRALALSIYTLGIHIFGDVPGPIIVGSLKDHFAPNCGPNGDESLCKSHRTALLIVLGLTLGCTNLGWIGCWWAMRSARNNVLKSLNDISVR